MLTEEQIVHYVREGYVLARGLEKRDSAPILTAHPDSGIL